MFDRMIVKHNNQTLQDIFDDALMSFPYSFQRTGIKSGSLYASTYVEYTEGITFTIANLFGIPLGAGGSVQLNFMPDEDEAPAIIAFFNIVRDFDFENGSILSNDEALLGEYDILSKTWTLQITKM